MLQNSSEIAANARRNTRRDQCDHANQEESCLVVGCVPVACLAARSVAIRCAQIPGSGPGSDAGWRLGHGVLLRQKMERPRTRDAFVRSRSRSLVRWPTVHDACSTGGPPFGPRVYLETQPRCPSIRAKVIYSEGTVVNQAWLLKNSHSRSSQKFHRARMPYKRRSRFWWTFSTPRLVQFFQKRGFFNSHSRLHEEPGCGERRSSLVVRLYGLRLSFDPSQAVGACSRCNHLFYLPVFQIDDGDLSVSGAGDVRQRWASPESGRDLRRRGRCEPPSSAKGPRPLPDWRSASSPVATCHPASDAVPYPTAGRSIQLETSLLAVSMTARRGRFWSAVKTQRPSCDIEMRCTTSAT